MKNPLDLPIKNKLIKFLIEKLTKLDDIKTIYQNWLDEPSNQHGTDGQGLLDSGLSYLDATLEIINQQNLDAIPASGATVFVANHPLGGLDGMLLTQMLLKIRPDLKVLTNEVLLTFPEFSDLFIGVDVLNKNKQKQNAKGILSLSRHLAAGGAALIFPAGIVSELRLKDFSIHDRPWDPMVARLIKKHHAHCLPIYVDARNSYPFYLSAFIHKRLRTALLGRAMLAKKHCRIKAIIGNIIEYKDFQHTKDIQSITEYLKLCCQSLKYNHNETDDQSIKQQRKLENIKQDIALENILAQHEILKEYQLLEYKSMAVYCAPHAKLGTIMEQIAITRERTFRAVDEGTGKELDSDIYDPYCWHLWVWDNDKNLIVGGYRLSKVDEVINNYGLKKLHSHSLYNYDRAFIRSLRHSVEVGRSFVAPEYQRHPRALDLLWKGIGVYMLNNPNYHTLFGGVSISQQYSNLARALLADTLTYHYAADESISRHISPRKPLSIQNKPWSHKLLPSLSKIPIINKLLGTIDSGKTIPILIRHYLALNGKFITFSINESFNKSLDGLILVDLRKSPDKYLARYLGVNGTKEFKKTWEIHKNAA
ncbi:MAG: lysophospholipid acyltransferase family protein [Alcanivoracaceae bacterium]|nr:lysophospholipid acyltransferase family protein [Alcanivoracaceae bacterium]